jgi:hypothetical protein
MVRAASVLAEAVPEEEQIDKKGEAIAVEVE